jgi:hypothetical protein
MTPTSGTVDVIGTAVGVAVGGISVGVAIGGTCVGAAAGAPHAAINIPFIMSTKYLVFILQPPYIAVY